MSAPIGYYVHHQGDGHRQRAIAIARHAPDRFVLLGTGLAGRVEDLACVDLADDRPAGTLAFAGCDGVVDRPEALHYAPYQSDGVRRRVAALTGWIATARPSLMVIDVSAEIAMLARLAATPTLYVRLAGARGDPAHLDAFRGAVAVLAPFAQALDDANLPAWVRDKTRYFAGLAGSSERDEDADRADILLVVGRGGSSICATKLACAARATPTRQWTVLGQIAPPSPCPPNLKFMGWVGDANARIGRARLVVGAAGDGVVNAVLAADRPYVCLPEARPYDEQVAKAQRLGALGAAVTLEAWPAPSEWTSILAAAEALPPAGRQALHARDGDAAAAAFILETADAQVRETIQRATAS